LASKDTSALYSQAQKEGLAMAFFRLPGGHKINHISGGLAQRVNDDEKAYVFAPFDGSTKPYFIVPEGKAAAAKSNTESKVKSVSKKSFTDYVKAITSAIATGAYQKIVAARILGVDKPVDFSPVAFFEKLCAAYPTAFVSLTHIPGVGQWIGASPEILAAQDSSKLMTYSLAGTKAIDDTTEWGDKEKEEQSIVTEFIRKMLMKVSDAEIMTKGPVTNEAGKLKHLLTIFTLRSNETGLWQKVVKSLHPTPAVGGMPQAKAAKFIMTQESFDRKFYAGYLGPVNWTGKTNIFVNLRCLEVTDKQLIFYAGCGITADSDPGKEWLESERKIEVLRSLI
jgi:isochorismate synthase